MLARLTVAAIGNALASGQQAEDVQGCDDRIPERCAAVALIVHEGVDGLSVLLIERTKSEQDPWSGHVAFPGGRYDAGDRSLLCTAVREAHEEVGLDLEQHATCLGRLPDVAAVSRGRRLNLTIRPYVFHLHTLGALRPDPREVAATLWANLDRLLSGNADTCHRYRLAATDGGGSVNYELPAYEVQGRVVWGLTYTMLSGLLHRSTSVTVTL